MEHQNRLYETPIYDVNDGTPTEAIRTSIETKWNINGGCMELK
jgi:hypothetical protein